jgi:iron complex outermembrane receptor protein
MNRSTNTHLFCRGKLLSTVSAVTLFAASAHAGGMADSDRPTVWIDLGWQYERINSLGDTFTPPFLAIPPRPDFEHQSPLDVEKTLPWAYGADGKLSFQPKGSDWVFAAAVRYGRTSGRRHTHDQVASKFLAAHGPFAYTYFPLTRKFSDATGANSESHVVMDFQAGRDVGLGRFGSGGTSIFSAGVRYAQFTSHSTSLLREDPDLSVRFPPPKYFPSIAYHNYFASAVSNHSFHGIGPSISWNASAALMGDPSAGEISLDWGVNAAVLFGRQKSTVQHETRGDYYRIGRVYNAHTQYQTSTKHTRIRGIAVPNVGGFASISYRFANAKVSLGYRADSFFGAIDGGIDNRKSYDRNYNGPFATISIGLP